MHSIDLNADLGEGGGTDTELLTTVTSASVACGAHAGSEDLMRSTVRAARAAGVVVGAHPGYPDREEFGRHELRAPPADIERWVEEQVGALCEICGTEGVTLRYVKAHGALYNRAVHDLAAATALVVAAARVDRGLAVLALAGSAMLTAARSAGLPTVHEAFLDRGYLSDGSLAPRAALGALIADEELAAEWALRIARGEPVADLDGRPLLIEADSLCVHGDSPAALQMACAARVRLLEAGVTLAPFAR